jgi:hypothetical protein
MDVPADLTITITDVRRVFCAGVKTRRWFVDHGFDFQRFLREGVPATEFLEKGDALAERVVARKLSQPDG